MPHSVGGGDGAEEVEKAFVFQGINIQIYKPFKSDYFYGSFALM
jgi:hypothetical protein